MQIRKDIIGFPQSIGSLISRCPIQAAGVETGTNTPYPLQLSRQKLNAYYMNPTRMSLEGNINYEITDSWGSDGIVYAGDYTGSVSVDFSITRGFSLDLFDEEEDVYSRSTGVASISGKASQSGMTSPPTPIERQIPFPLPIPMRTGSGDLFYISGSSLLQLYEDEGTHSVSTIYNGDGTGSSYVSDPSGSSESDFEYAPISAYCNLLQTSVSPDGSIFYSPIFIDEAGSVYPNLEFYFSPFGTHLYVDDQYFRNLITYINPALDGYAAIPGPTSVKGSLNGNEGNIDLYYALPDVPGYTVSSNITGTLKFNLLP